MPELEYYIEFKTQISEPIQIKKPLDITSVQVTKNEEQTVTTKFFTPFENEFEKKYSVKNAENIIITFEPLLLKTKNIIPLIIISISFSSQIMILDVVRVRKMNQFDLYK